MEGLLDTSMDDKIRSDCRRFLVSCYKSIGDKDKLLAIAEKCDHIICSKEAILSDGLWGEDGIKANQDYLAGLVFALSHELFRSGHYLNLDKDLKKESYDIVLSLHDFVYRGDYGFNNYMLSTVHCYYAEFIQKDKPDEAVESLRKAFAHAKADDEIAEGEGYITYTSPLANRIRHDRKYSNKGNTVRKILGGMTSGAYGSKSRYKPLADNPGYIALIAEMKDWLAKKADS
jgi:hypothetical protein